MSHREAENPGASVTVATTDTPILAARPARAELTICNDGANVVYLRLAATGSALSQGIRLAPGATYTTAAYLGPVCGIAATGATVVTVVEV